MSASPYLYNELTKQIIAAARRVHRQLGAGHRESACVAALVTALRNDGLETGTQIRALVRDENGRQAGAAIVDVTVNDRVAIEVKAIGEINDAHKAQLRAWLRANGVIAVGLVINFGPTFEIARAFEPNNYDARQ